MLKINKENHKFNSQAGIWTTMPIIDFKARIKNRQNQRKESSFVNIDSDQERSSTN